MLRRVMDESEYGTNRGMDHSDLCHETYGLAIANESIEPLIETDANLLQSPIDSKALITDHFQHAGSLTSCFDKNTGEPGVRLDRSTGFLTVDASERALDKELSHDLLRIYLRQMDEYRSLDEQRKLELTENLRQANKELNRALSAFPGVSAWILQEGQNVESVASDTKQHGPSDNIAKHLSIKNPEIKLNGAERVLFTNTPKNESGFALSTADDLNRQWANLAESYKLLRELTQRYGVHHVVCNRQRQVLKSAFCKIDHSPIVLIRLVGLFFDAESDYKNDPAQCGLEFEKKRMRSDDLFAAQYAISRRDYEKILEQVKEAYTRWQQARNKLVEVHLGLVVFLSKQYFNDTVDNIDLIQEGNLGLIKAVERFNPDLGYRFSTYASYWIRLAISRCTVRFGRTVRLPFRVNEDIVSINRQVTRLRQKSDHDLGESEIANMIKVPVADLRKVNLISQGIASMDAPFDSSESGNDLHSLLKQKMMPQPLDAVAQKNLKDAVSKSLARLNEREVFVIRQRFGIGNYGENTLQDLGHTLGLTRERIRQIEMSALKKLRRPLKAFYNEGIE